MAYRVEFSGVTITCDSVGEAAFLARELATPVRAPEPRPTFVVPASVPAKKTKGKTTARAFGDEEPIGSQA